MGTYCSHVTQIDRMSIQALLQAQLNGPEIARRLGFSRSTINREINRSKVMPTAAAADYQAGVAQARSVQQRRADGAARCKLGSDLESPLWRTVMNGLRCRWSPEQIAAKPPGMNEAAIKAGQAMPANPMSVSHGTICCAIYALPRTTLRTALVGLLRKSHKTRLTRASAVKPCWSSSTATSRRTCSTA